MESQPDGGHVPPFVRGELKRIEAARKQGSTGDAYERHKLGAADLQRKKAKSGQNIGPPSPPVDPARRAEGESSLRRFCELYFPSRFHFAWSPDHLQVLARMEESIRHGGLFAIAMPRGGGKTSLCEVASLWSVITGLHQFLMLLAVSGSRATQLLESIKVELLTNDLLHEDWSEITHPIRALEGRANRAKGQHIDGRSTYIAWRSTEIILPTVARDAAPWASDAASGSVLRVAGITSGSIRGPKLTRPCDGKNVRPSLAILDDPQDDKSARSPSQVENRHRLIMGAVLGMAGPGKRITAICPCTVIFQDDLASRLLDREKSPLWTGQRYQLLSRFPERIDLWDEYGVRRADEIRNDGTGALATAWYGEQKEVMDRGALASWPERKHPEELSAVQHAMNLYYQDRAAFMAEYQNEPMEATLGTGEQLKADAIGGRCNGLARGIVPLSATRLTAYVDVQQKLLYWLVAAWADDFTGAVIDYGAYPDQRRAYFTLADAQKTLARASPGAGLEGCIYAGLEKVADLLLAREWQREDGAAMRIERLLVDANWGALTDTVYTWCRRTPQATQVTPAHGRYVGASSKPWSEYTPKDGERIGFHWLIPAGAGKRATRYMLIDTNHWKSFVVQRLAMAAGDRGALTLFGQAGQDHHLLADHLVSEYCVRTEGRGREVDEWKQRPEKPDNHWWDCLTGAAAAASMQGAKLPVASGPAPARRRKVSFAEMQRRAKGGK